MFKFLILNFMFICNIFAWDKSDASIFHANSRKWHLKTSKKIDYIDFRNINSDYFKFIKIDIFKNRNEKKTFILGKNFNNQIKKNDLFLSKENNYQDSISQDKKDDNIWNFASIEYYDNISNIQLDSRYKYYYQAEISNDFDEKQLIILCQTSEELNKNAEEKLDKAVTEAGIGVVEIGMGVAAISQGHVAGGAASCAAGAYEIKESFENFKEAKELFEEARQLEEKENKKEKND